VIRREAITVLVGVPVHLLTLVRRDPTLRVKSVVFATDHVPDPICAELEHAWGCSKSSIRVPCLAITNVFRTLIA
jgi:hypothetical protein